MLRQHPLDSSLGSAPSPASPRPGERSGQNPIERKALYRVQHDVAAMPASLVVQLAIWPDEIAAWARSEGSSESLVYNMLAHRKPYQRVRERLAGRLEVPPAILAHLVDARRPQPAARRDPSVGLAEPTQEPIDWSRPPFPLHRDGTNPIERRAMRVVEREIASMPASAVVGLALWPLTLAEWSRHQRLKSSIVWATLAGSPSERIRADLARRLDVTRRDLDDLIAARRPEPTSSRTAEAPPPAPTRTGAADEPDDASVRPLRPAAPTDEPSAPDQLSLGF